MEAETFRDMPVQKESEFDPLYASDRLAQYIKDGTNTLRDITSAELAELHVTHPELFNANPDSFPIEWLEGDK